MIRSLIKLIIGTTVIALGLTLSTYLFKLFNVFPNTSMQDMLFWAGAIPAAIAGVSLSGNVMGKGDASYLIAQTMMNNSSSDRMTQEIAYFQNAFKSCFNWILAGVIVILFSIFL